MTETEQAAFDREVDRIFSGRVSSPAREKSYECEKCMDTGFIQVRDENGEEVSRRCGCMEVKRFRRLLERSGISKEFLGKRLEDFDTMGNPQLIKAKDKAARYLRSFEGIERQRRNSIMFYGQPGSGKTHLGAAISSGLMGRGIAVAYMAYRDAVTRIKQNMTDEERYTEMIGQYMNARVLYIDDLLKGRVTESDVNIMYEIVNHRYMNNMPMIVSTEKSLEELLEFDEAVGSRIVEMSRGNMARLEGQGLNYRLYSLLGNEGRMQNGQERRDKL